MAGNINRVIITGNLTKDPELQTLSGAGTNVCSLRIACNGRRKNIEGQWEDQPNYFDVTVWGQQGDNCKRYLTKGRGGRDRRKAALAGVDRRRGRSDRLSISSLKPCSSSAAATTPAAAEREWVLEQRAQLPRATSRSIPATSCALPRAPVPRTTTSRSEAADRELQRTQGDAKWRSNVDGRFAGATEREDRRRDDARPARTVATRSSRSTTRMFPRFGGSSPIGARSDRGGSPAPADGIRARSRVL